MEDEWFKWLLLGGLAAAVGIVVLVGVFFGAQTAIAAVVALVVFGVLAALRTMAGHGPGGGGGGDGGGGGP